MKFPQEQSEGLGGAQIDIASLYSYSQALTEPVSLPGLTCRFKKADA